MIDRNGPLSVLIVEDNPGDAVLAEAALEQTLTGAHCTIVDCLADAIDAMQHATPDVVLLDMGLPDTVGLGGVEMVLANAPLTPLIVLTGLRDHNTALQALETGAQDYLVKGEYSPDTLERAVRYSIERKRTERELIEAARFDAVTGLINRSYFVGLLDHALERAKRNSTSVHVLFLDLDHFKNINDTLGHAAGDALLREVGGRLKGAVRSSDVVARLGGDEFTVMVEDAGSVTTATLVAEKILRAMQPSFEINGVNVLITPSIGIAGFPEAGDDSSSLLQHADTAMYRAKSTGRNTVEFFSDAMTATVRDAFDLEMALRQALQKSEFELYYQPILDARTGTVTCVEALLRWQREGYDEPLQPGELAPMLESSGLIRDVGDWVLRTACRQCKTWQDRLVPGLRLSVNVTPKQLAMPNFVDRLRACLHESDLAPQSLSIDVNEQVLLDHDDVNLATLAAIRDIGVSVAINDFGSTYSALNHLTVFPFDSVKIDRNLIAHMAERNDDGLITAGILSIASGLGRNVVAESMESEEPLHLLGNNACGPLQGLLFSEPLAASDFEACFSTSSVRRLRTRA